MLDVSVYGAVHKSRAVAGLEVVAPSGCYGLVSLLWQLSNRRLENQVVTREIGGSTLHRLAQSLIFALQQAIAASPLLGVSSLDSGRSRSGLFSARSSWFRQACTEALDP